MRTAIFSLIPAVENSMVASTKIARFVRDELQFPLIWDEQISEMRNLDVLIIVNGAYAFCNQLEPLSHAVINAKRIIWIQNDYSVVPPINDGKAESPFRKAFVIRKEQGKPHLDFWTTCAKESLATDRSCYVNWNCLSMLERAMPAPWKSDDLAYYGSYRANRKKYFDRYFELPKCRVIISSPSRKFAEIYVSELISHCGTAPDLIKWLSERGLGLYLEDARSHREYHSPPNRFYEMLSAGLGMVFQPEAGQTLRKAGYEIGEFTIESFGNNSLKNMMDRRAEIAVRQYRTWFDHASKERRELNSVVKNAWMKFVMADK